jgi:vanillate/3-O-methylgallate O-demethylase
MDSKKDMKALIADLRIPPENYFTLIWGSFEYTNWIEESMSWKETCYLGDWTGAARRSNVLAKGPDALRLFTYTGPNSTANWEVGRAKHLAECNSQGKVISDGVLIRVAEDEFVYGGNPWCMYLSKKLGFQVEWTKLDTTAFQISGPNALFVVEQACGESLRDVKFMHYKMVKIAGHDVLALRQGMAGEVGFELQGPYEHYQEIYDAIWAAGQDWGMKRLGGRSVMLNHLEACFPTKGEAYLPAIYDEDMSEYLQYLRDTTVQHGKRHIGGSFESDDIRDWYRSPVELGWGKAIKFDHDFIGREALEKEVANPKRTMVTLEWNDDDVADVLSSIIRDENPYDFMDMPRDFKQRMNADKVLKGGKLVGVATSRGYSATFRKMLSLCVIDIELSTPGTEVSVIWGAPGHRQKEIRAVVAKAPYKKDNRRLDLRTLTPENYPKPQRT